MAFRMRLPMLAFDHSSEAKAPDARWLQAFHDGDLTCLRDCYVQHFELVYRVVGDVLPGSDRDTVVHEVFFRLLTDGELRGAFHGGSLAAWLRVVARNQAIDHRRRRRLEILVPDASQLVEELSPAPVESQPEQRLHVQLTLERFRNSVLPAKWRAVFQARFVEQMDQPTAARALG